MGYNEKKVKQLKQRNWQESKKLGGKIIAAFLENTFNLTFNVQTSQAYIK